MDHTFDHERVKAIERFATPTIELLGTEYPNGLRIDLAGPHGAPITPKGLHPVFYGCYDWHSAVHSHWQLVRAIRYLPATTFATTATAVLDEHLTAANIATEMRWIGERPSFEMPYGMAWALLLCDELRRWGSDVADGWLDALVPLEDHGAAGFERYCETMTTPMRGGLHNQSAFSLGLAHDWAVRNRARSGDLGEAIVNLAERLFTADVDVDLAYEPSAADFLSPALSEADLLRRTLDAGTFADWLERFAPGGFTALKPVTVVDPSNGQLAHWAGLNLSRSWMLHAIADALPDGHPHIRSLRTNASEHAAAGLPMAGHPDYMISHWVPTFAVYLLSEAYWPDQRG